MFCVGLDLGQRRDHSAIVVVERQDRPRDFLAPQPEGLQVRYVERVPLGTVYPAVVERVRKIVNHAELAGNCTLAVDGTGVGAPVVDMLRVARLGCEICPVTITGGGREHMGPMGRLTGWSVPKQDLLAGVQVALESGELTIARGLAEVGALVKELVDVTMTRSERGRVRMGAEGQGAHDDLVIALALACWCARRRRVGFGTRRLTGI